jgi:anthranilate synthase component 1
MSRKISIYPDFGVFASNYASQAPQVIYTSLVADLETPVSAMLKIGAHSKYSFLLESVEGGSVRGRYSIIGMEPDIIWRCYDNSPEINRNAITDTEIFTAEPGGSLHSLRELLQESEIVLPENLPPMAAGLVGYMGYDTVRLMEDIPDKNPPNLSVPDGLFIRPTIMAIFDSVLDTLTIVTPVRFSSDITAEGAYNTALQRVSAVTENFARDLNPERGSLNPDLTGFKAKSNMGEDSYKSLVNRAKEYIAAGDIFQVVLSQRFSVPFKESPFTLYRALRRLNPSPFLFYLNFDQFCVVGSSPEILVRLRDEKVTIRPLAGTRKRGSTASEDQMLATELREDPKECAEHLMLLDLGRNDVGRVTKTGTVEVSEQMEVEYYSHVMHLVSNVEGEVSDGLSGVDVLIAGFPAGTVSGAPKVRAMEIIDELESEKRGIYAGCVGYFSSNGTMDTCIALRTAIIKDGVMHVQAGAGIVADSVPELENEECWNKANALIRAAEQAIKYSADQN